MPLERLLLNINGVERAVVFDPEKDTLAVTLRRMGLTGTKLGCKIGVCGSCSVILDGKLIRSCTKKLKNVPERSEVLTIEGIGTPRNLHPLQQAFITYGSVQCGFCSPGFIVSAYALLQENPAPSREEVRAWFQKNKNTCRCTGYKQIVDAVMAASKVMRGEATIDEITYIHESDIYGSSHPRPAALAKVCGVCDYGDDIKLKMPEGTAHLAVVLSEVPHAKIIDIDISEAEKMPGVYKVMLGKDVKGSNIMPNHTGHKRALGDDEPYSSIIVDKVIRKCGEVVALVAADTEEHTRAAAKKVKQNLEILPAYMDCLDAVAPDALRIFDEIPNTHILQPQLKGEDTKEIMENSDFVVEGSFSSQHQPHLPIEPEVVQAYWDTEGNMTIQCKAQAVGFSRFLMSAGIGLTPDKIRIIVNPTGGSFGYSVFQGSYALVATAVQNLNMPCTLTMSYEEHQHYTGKRTGSHSNGRLACNKDGKITAAEWDIVLDHGPYALVLAHLLASCTAFAYHGYNIPNVKALGRAVSTNHAHGVSYRGFGSPQIYTCTEALMDMLADKAGIDPFEFRYINMAKPGETSVSSSPYREYPMIQIMDIARPIYLEYKASAEKARAEGILRGVGVAQGGFNVTIGSHDSAEVALELNADGTITHYNTWEDMGQGGDIGTLTHTVKALEPLGIKPEQVHLVLNDTARCPDTGIAAASRSHYMAGFATLDAARKLMDAMRKPDGSYRTHAEMVAEGIPVKYIGRHDLHNDGLREQDPNTGVGDRTPTNMYCVNLAEVEVDPLTGKTKVLRMVAVSDCGVIGNLLAVNGQAYGGLSHCIGFALSEDYLDVRKHNNIDVCGIPHIQDIPDDIKIIHVENPRPNGPQGSSGCSENFQASAHMAVINGIFNATGVRIYELPAKPEKVKAALEAKARGENLAPKKYFLGSDLYEEIENIKNNPV
ncbi:Xanthine dehydrogenase iron-sulfur subunit [Dehalobacter sp. UNSWDHB]|uniref:molybdopterin-dependent oxidoreductase n=1 Tax=Dehalobacter sp. UNSWDHB TaxID=1339256 RepID=UPI0003879AC3|nr:molybdopterin cofactor-binding domain-containing protein [Dehalobacter sp. UNSWDHB]EQB22211.1 Xanthine dehydrogenase iron-sulfur subunit [Dehalobacter sp. UNSWDHB]